jgi:hypothetical protein
MPPGLHLDPPIDCFFLRLQYRIPDTRLYAYGAKEDEDEERGKAQQHIYEHTLHMYTRLCQFCLQSNHGKSCRDRGANSMLLTSICCCNAVHQTCSRANISCFSTFTRILSSTTTTTTKPSALNLLSFSLDDATYYCNGVPAQYKVVIIYGGGLSMWHMA